MRFKTDIQILEKSIVMPSPEIQAKVIYEFLKWQDSQSKRKVTIDEFIERYLNEQQAKINTRA